MQNRKLTIATALTLVLATSMTISLQREVKMLKQEIMTEKDKNDTINSQNMSFKKSMEDLTIKNVRLQQKTESNDKKIIELKKELEKFGVPEDFQ